ncbi:hypothetical protein EDB19DRAFT_1831878 [Suillus lakei]|nr:hypothetical protein EDB19DRAFT_1831878 [Suillus lakei]
MPNQHKPTPPLVEITPHIFRLWKSHLTDKQIVQALQKEINTECYGIGLLHHKEGVSVTRSMVKSYFAIYEADLVHQRKAHHLQRRCFWAAGVNDIVTVDQHNKWLRFGLALHTRIELFSGCIMLIVTLEPKILELQMGMLQHRWMRTKKNDIPEIAWSQLRCQFTPGFESLLDHGVEQDWYDSDNTLQVVNLILTKTASTTLQNDVIRTSEVLPHRVPKLIYQSAEDFGALDFKIKVDKAAVDHVRAMYIKPGHPVFDLIPSDLGDSLQICYECLGCPVVNHKSAWTFYLAKETKICCSFRSIETYHFMKRPMGITIWVGFMEDLDLEDEPDVSHKADVNVTGLNNAGLVVWEFSDEEGDIMDEW